MPQVIDAQELKPGLIIFRRGDVHLDRSDGELQALCGANLEGRPRLPPECSRVPPPRCVLDSHIRGSLGIPRRSCRSRHARGSRAASWARSLATAALPSPETAAGGYPLAHGPTPSACWASTTSMSRPLELFLTTADVAGLASVSTEAVRKWARHGQLPIAARSLSGPVGAITGGKLTERPKSDVAPPPRAAAGQRAWL